MRFLVICVGLTALASCSGPKDHGANCFYTDGQSQCIQACMIRYKSEPEKANQCMAGVREEAERKKK